LLSYSTTGGKFTQPERLTYSIIPDGTSIGGTPSNLQQTFNASFPTATWQAAIQRAAAVWENVANIELVQVPDSGAPIGIAGDQQGDGRFGDIRIGGFAQPSSQLGFAFVPPPFNGGTTAGDIFLNTAQPWQINNNFDLEAVAIHELGHDLGMGHSTIATADMYASYSGIKQATTADDAAGIQSIYAAPQPDGAGHGSYRTALNMTGQQNPSTGALTLAAVVISSTTDVDWYSLTAPSTANGPVSVRVQASTLSSLEPAVQIYNGNLTLLGSAAATTFGATVTATAQVAPGSTFYVKVLGNTTGPGAVGAYGLQAYWGSNAPPPIAPPNTTVPEQPDQKQTTMNEGTGWNINCIFTPYLGKLELGIQLNVLGIPLGVQIGLNGRVTILGLTLDTGLDLEGLWKITVGTLSGYGDTLGVGELPHHGGPAHDAGASHGGHGDGQQGKTVHHVITSVPQHMPNPVTTHHTGRAFPTRTAHFHPTGSIAAYPFVKPGGSSLA
jgi:hypothetical protein